jgi:hypothetical protein
MFPNIMTGARRLTEPPVKEKVPFEIRGVQVVECTTAEQACSRCWKE